MVERRPTGTFLVNVRPSGKQQYDPRQMAARLACAFARGIFSPRWIERATWRGIGMCFVAANMQPHQDTITTFWRANKVAFLQVLLIAQEAGLLGLVAGP